MILSEGHITEEEKKQFAELTTQTSEWWNKNKEAQAKLQFYENPIFELTELINRRENLHNLVTKLINKPKPAV